MHVAIFGAGALGRVYGVRLATLAGATVTFVVRPARLSDGVIRIERVDGDHGAVDLAKPERLAAVPADADVVLVCVRGDQLDADLVAVLQQGPDVPAVILTPMMPADYTRLRAALGARVVAAMPNVVAYAKDDRTTRYWLPRAATTLIEEARPADATLDALCEALDAAGISARQEMGVHETNPATTIAFIPLAMGLDAAGGIDALLGDEALLDLSLRAAAEGATLAHRLGKVATWAGVVLRFVGPTTLKLGVALARSRAPEAVAYVEAHFGRKLHAQNVAMAEAIVDLARERGVPHDAMIELTARLRSR